MDNVHCTSSLQNRLKRLLLILFVAFAAAGAVRLAAPVKVEAETSAGFKNINGYSYYVKADGSYHTGFLVLDGKTYYFYSSGKQCKGWLTKNGSKYYFYKNSDPLRCYMATGWMKDSSGNKRFFNSKGIMATGFYKISDKVYYFSKTNGIAKRGWLTYYDNKYFFNTTSGRMYTNKMVTNANGVKRYLGPSGKMVRGWYSFEEGKKRYFKKTPVDGAMATGWFSYKNSLYYLDPETGYAQTGWVTRKSNGNRYYMNPENGGAMAKSCTLTINGDTYKFDSNGIASPVSIAGQVSQQTDGRKTIKNYLLGALQPVGQALYVWGGGWTDSTRKGVSPVWKQWYDSNNSSYNYNNYRDLSVSNRVKGLDCSGFVGWAAYQVMHTTSGVGYGYTVVSGEVGSSYKTLGWGTIVTQSMLANTNYKLVAGDVGYNDGHTWIVIGQCSDKSIVIVHSTPQAGCQIAGTPTPDGNYLSEAITLAKKYMSRYSGYTKYDYHTSSGNYVRNGNYLRWNTATLADPEGYRNMNAAQILADLFS